jgi:hypothetical protein
MWGGSFAATTLDSLIWPNGEQFSASGPGSAESLLTIVAIQAALLLLSVSLLQSPALEIRSESMKIKVCFCWAVMSRSIIVASLCEWERVAALS